MSNVLIKQSSQTRLNLSLRSCEVNVEIFMFTVANVVVNDAGRTSSAVASGHAFASSAVPWQQSKLSCSHSRFPRRSGLLQHVIRVFPEELKNQGKAKL